MAYRGWRDSHRFVRSGGELPRPQQLTIRLNHRQEFADKIDVTYSPPAIDPQQTSERKELANTEIEGVPYPAPQDYRNALPLLNGLVFRLRGAAHSDRRWHHELGADCARNPTARAASRAHGL